MGEVIPFRLRRRVLRPSPEELAWLMSGVFQMGGMLPNFDAARMHIPDKVVKACVDAGWVEPWFADPAKKGRLIHKLTEEGRIVALAGMRDADSAGPEGVA
jgi:hypothetical protein